jgi:hypothetical protein
MGGGTGTGGGPKIYLMVFAAGLVLGYAACHFNICQLLGICGPVAVEQHPGPTDPGPR